MSREAASSEQPAVLLHGLGRTSGSMRKMASALEAAGFQPLSLDYPSTRVTVDEAAELVATGIERAGWSHRATDAAPRPLHFVTHSLGAVVLRRYAARYGSRGIGRAVMLAPPNSGSELSDTLARNPLCRFLLGPALGELGTGEDSVPNRLGPIDFFAGVIAGNASFNPVFSYLIPGEDDGKVAVARARVEGMRDFLVVPRSHTFIMNSREVQKQTVHFLREGCFRKEG